MDETYAADTKRCEWCGDEFDESELYRTDLGYVCDRCIAAIRSRGEQITIYD